MLTPIRAGRARADGRRSGTPAPAPRVAGPGGASEADGAGDGAVGTDPRLDTAGHLDDGALVATLAARGDAAVAALGELYERHAPAVYGYLRERLAADGPALIARDEEALDEVFHRLWSRPSMAPRDPARLARWLVMQAEQVVTALGASPVRGGAPRLEDVLITPELARRAARAPDLGVENDALFRIARRLATHASPDDVLQTVVDTAVELCGAGTAGLSLIETPADGGEPVFRWTHMAGELAGAVGGCTPRGHSPCGVTLERGAPQLFREPRRYFEYLAATPSPIVEGLVIPLVGGVETGASPIGTIWIVSHDAAARGFDWEDARVMTSLASFTSIALQIAEANVQHAAREAMREREASAQVAVDRQKDEFLASVSHDLKNPLTTIRGTAQLLRRQLARGEPPPPASADGSLAAIEGACVQMSDQLDTVLDVTRSRMGRPLDLLLRPTELVGIAHQLVEEAQRASDTHRVILDSAPAELVGTWDGARLRRALRNLLANALAYSPDGGEVTVSIGTERDERSGQDRVVLCVRDRGLGIPAADLPFVFERFYRGANVAGRIGGSGIGLADVREVIGQHGGAVEVESTEGAGSRFIVHLPLSPPAASDGSRRPYDQ